MARVDYYGVAVAVAAQLRADPDLVDMPVEVENEVNFEAGQSPWIGVYVERRSAPAGLQSLSAGTETRFMLQLSIWCWAWSLESTEQAIKQRDDVVGKVELALMRDRTFGEVVRTSWLEGGELPAGRLQGDSGAVYLSGGQITLTCEAHASTQ